MTERATALPRNAGETFDPACRRCPRLAGFLAEIRVQHPDYFSAPVPSFGPRAAPLLIVGLAPGMHGANATGRAFTGDYAGVLLYRTLHEFGFASRPESVSADDELVLTDCRITNAVRCLPPQNKPVTAEMDTCNPYLVRELAEVTRPGIVVALGTIAHRAVLKALGLRLSGYTFGHAKKHDIADGLTLIDSYHCSRYNTQTRRLTADMFRDVFRTARAALSSAHV